MLLLAMLGQSAGQDMAKPFAVTQPIRLAITPDLDGKIASEEWDVLSTTDTFKSYFEWEPEKIYWAAQAPAGQDVVLSLDEKADGWLIGNDNYEFRVSFNDGQPTLSVRRLDATDPAGPRWIDANMLHEAVKMAVSKTDTGWSLEASYTPPATVAPTTGTKLGVRVDTVPAGSDIGDAYLPRSLSFVTLAFDYGQNLPTGFSWKPDFLVRRVPVEDTFKVKYGFKRDAPVEFKQIEYRPEGYAKGVMAEGTRPFPLWDKKGRCGEEYTTSLGKDASLGYRVLRATLKNADGSETVLRSSFRVAELLDFDVNLPKSLDMSSDARIVRGSVALRSNGLGRITGQFELKVPGEWTITRGKDTKFTIYHSRGVSSIPVEIIVPKDTVGVFPLTFTATIGEKVITKTLFIPVGQP